MSVPTSVSDSSSASTASHFGVLCRIASRLAATGVVASAFGAALAEAASTIGATEVRFAPNGGWSDGVVPPANGDPPIARPDEASALATTPSPWPQCATAQTDAENHEVRLAVAGGELYVAAAAPLTEDAEALLRAIADMASVAFTRDQRLRALEADVARRSREMAEHQALIECVVDSLPVGLYVVDRAYRIHAWNHQRETGLQGVSRSHAIGRTIFEIMHRQPADLLKREFDEVFATGRLQQFQMDSDAFGEARSYRISKIPMKLGGDDVSHVITIGEDITQWRLAMDRTAQTEKLAAIGQLAAGIMHEINNPLATIAACAESLAMTPSLGSASEEWLRIIDLEVHRCKRIVNGLLDFSRPKPAASETFELNDVINHATLLLQHHPRFKRVHMHLSLAAPGSIFVDGDRDQLVQVVLALAINAMDAAGDGGNITLRAGRDVALPHAVHLEVEDDGPGIPRALQGKIFEPFFTTKPQGQGTGLGLSICYGIVNDHDGQLELVPTDHGTTFRATFAASSSTPARDHA